MNPRVPFVFALCLFLLTTGCLDALTNSSNSGKFWGEDCEEVSEEICPSGEAPDFSLVDQNGNEVADGEQSVILKQVENGVAVRMAVLSQILKK